jgi:hypothetical protein
MNKLPGADCSSCPFSATGTPVQPRGVSHPKLTVLLDRPNWTEAKKGRMGHGTSWIELQESARALSVPLGEVALEAAVRCSVEYSPSYLDLKKAARACSKDRSFPTEYVLASGSLAVLGTQGVTNVKDVVGVPNPAIQPEHQSIATFSFAEVISDKAPQLRKVFEWNLYKAWMYATNDPVTHWKWPETYTLETHSEAAVVKALRDLLKAPSLGLDVETPMPEKVTDFIDVARRLLNVGFGSRKLGIAVSVTWPDADDEVREAVIDLLKSPIPKVMFNGQFDARVFFYNGLPCENYAIDPMEQWRMLHPFIADATDKKGKSGKSLDFVASALTFAPGWKREFKHATSVKLTTGQDVFEHGDKADRAIYNARDSYMQDMVGEMQMEELRQIPNYEALFAQRMRNIRKGIQMTVYGISVHEDVRAFFSTYYGRMIEAQKSVLLDLVKKYGCEKIVRVNSKGKAISQEFRPTNVAHIGHVFTAMGVHNSKLTKSGRTAWDADVLVELISHDNKDVRAFAGAVLGWRAPQKLKSTYIDELPVYDDGCVHIEWSPGGTVSGRWASRNPNGQNFPNMLDILYKPRKKWVVKFDFSQLELRIVALISQCGSLLKDYADGVDVHARNASMIFGTPKPSKKQRHFAKIFVYSANYGAGLNTIYAQVVSATDPNTGAPMFADMTKMQIAKCVAKWFAARPEIKVWQDASIAEAIRLGYVEEKVSGLRLFFPEGKVDPSRVLNFQAQSLAGKIANDFVDALDDECITRQIHDSIEIETDDPMPVIEKLQHLFTKEYDFQGHKMAFPGDIAVSRISYGNWVPVIPGKEESAIQRAEEEYALWLGLGKIARQHESADRSPDHTN